MRAFLPDMVEKNKGHIVNITSIAGSFATANLTDYCASKFGATGFSQSLTLELREMGKTSIKVTCVQPYTVKTDLLIISVRNNLYSLRLEVPGDIPNCSWMDGRFLISNRST